MEGLNSHPLEHLKNPGVLPKNSQDPYTQTIYLELEFVLDLFNGGVDLPPFPRLVSYVIGKYGTGDWCELDVVENSDDACRLLLNGESFNLGACCTANEDWEAETCDAGIPVCKIHLKPVYTLIFFKKQEKIKLDFILILLYFCQLIWCVYTR